LDGLTLANDGDDVFSNANFNLINSDLRGQGGNDTISLGSVSSSTVNGNSGNDVINSLTTAGGAQAAGTTLVAATVLGGQGNDTINIVGDGSGNNINGNRGNDSVILTGSAQGTVATSTLFGGQGNDIVTLATNTIDGNTPSGDLGNDTLTGAASNDILLGGDGADLLNSTAGADTLTGGEGGDAFTTGNNGVVGGVATGINLNGTDDNFTTITDFVTGATGETITVNVATAAAAASAAIDATGNVVTTSNTDLFSNLTTAATAFDGINLVQTVTLVAAANGVGAAFAGEYILVQDGAVGGATALFGANDVVIQANTTGLVAANVVIA